MIFKNAKIERGYYSTMRGEPNWLPIPFPRYFTPKTISENGRIMQQ